MRPSYPYTPSTVVGASPTSRWSTATVPRLGLEAGHREGRVEGDRDDRHPFKDYRPLKFFSLVALIFCIGGLCAGMPVVTEYLATGSCRGSRPPSSPRRSCSRPPSRSPRASSWTPWRKSSGSNGSSAYTARPRKTERGSHMRTDRIYIARDGKSGMHVLVRILAVGDIGQIVSRSTQTVSMSS